MARKQLRVDASSEPTLSALIAALVEQRYRPLADQPLWVGLHVNHIVDWNDHGEILRTYSPSWRVYFHPINEDNPLLAEGTQFVDLLHIIQGRTLPKPPDTTEASHNER